jgi:hypothetical protein
VSRHTRNPGMKKDPGPWGLGVLTIRSLPPGKPGRGIYGKRGGALLMSPAAGAAMVTGLS